MRALSLPALPGLLLALAALLPPAGAAAQARPDSAVLVTRLGVDTLAVERIVRTPGRVEVEALVRTPTTTLTRYTVDLSPDGELRRLVSTAYTPGASGPTPLAAQEITRAGDSIRVVTRNPRDGSASEAVLPAPGGVLPFIETVHWPFELAFMRLRAGGAAQPAQPLLLGSRVVGFPVAAVGADSVTLTHPSRGTMRARVDAAGRLLGLSAEQTTRKLVVERRPWMEIGDLARRFIEAERAGRGIRELSGRGEARATLRGASIAVDYGTPGKRGRRVWGALVPYGQVWRTGANQATHLTTDRDLRFGSLLVPAGRYTLFSIPAAGGGVLIINRQTGQTGTAYDAARDLGRVPLTARPLSTPVETFTIAVTEEGNGGALRLQWDDTELIAPFEVVSR